jgi:ATP-dependent exoDNAse (exonuclease V) alpha subunit
MLPARNLLYTAVTRSKNLLVVIGRMKALAMTLKPAGDEKTVFVIDSHTTSDRHWP